MIRLKNYKEFLSIEHRYMLAKIIGIALFWTLIDLVVTLLAQMQDGGVNFSELLTRTLLILTMSLIMAYIYVVPLSRLFISKALWLNFLLKAFILLLSALIMNFAVTLLVEVMFNNMSAADTVRTYVTDKINVAYLLDKAIYLSLIHI